MKAKEGPEEMEADNMLTEFDFRGGVKGKHASILQQGYSVKVHRLDGTTPVQQFTLVKLG